MTKALEALIERIKTLPEDQQDWYARFMLAKMDEAEDENGTNQPLLTRTS